MRTSTWLTALSVGACLSMSSLVHAAPSLSRSFQEAAEEFNVPAELLMGVSYTTTAWHNARGFDRHSAQEFGVMGLRSYDTGPSLREAAILLGTTPEQVRDQLPQNIRGGAALLAAYAREANHGQPVVGELTLDTAALWWSALGRYAGVADGRHQDLFAAQVMETLDQGAEGRSESGELVVLSAVPLPSVLGEWIEQARAQYQRQIDATQPAVDYSGASWVAACSSNYSNYSRTASDISHIVIHKIEGSYSGCISWFQNCSASVSAHYVVSKGGAVTQMVKEEDVAWHAGNWDYNLMSVGIEHEGYTNSDDVTDSEYQGSANLVKDVCSRNGIAKTRSYIIGHNEVPGATHTDPGPYWDWDYYMALIGGTGGGGGGGGDTSTGTLLGVIRADDIYTGENIVGATVTLNTGASVKTDSSGYYEFTGLKAGSYTVTADADCYSASSINKTVTAGVDNWASMALYSDGTCGGDGTADGGSTGDGCRVMAPELPTSRIHTASTNPLSRLPWQSVGFTVGMVGSLLLIRRRQQR